MLLQTTVAREELVSIGDYFYYADLNKVCKVEVTRIIRHDPYFSTTLFFDVDFEPTGKYVIKKDIESAQEFNDILNTAWNKTRCPEEGSFIAFKKVVQVREHENWRFPTGVSYIAVLEIPKDAQRVTTVYPEEINNNYYTYKCRADKVKVLRIETLNGDVVECKGISCYYKKCCVYETGKMVYSDSFDHDPKNECSHGIHFFMRREDAVNY